MLRLSDINFRDPFILPVPDERAYYLYGTEGAVAWSGKPSGFDCYRSTDLEQWEGPLPAFRVPEGFWADHHFWAPEVHLYEGRYYMFASFKAEERRRATQILVADRPGGPFVPHGEGPVTPSDWECLDGTLYVDESGKPWMVFCREWLQVTDGEMYAVELKPALDGTVGEPVLLFRASESGWSLPGKEGQYVTDGPFMHRMADGELVMLWSSLGTRGYAMGIARSASGLVTGPWTHEAEPFYKEDGGHGMLFRDFGGRLLLTIHTPNRNPQERPVLLELRESGGRFELAEAGAEA
ncbi:glycoside hydrolase family 43 protein [Paenibacillus puerhi]|uniref:glycoside hydrolase family 43 protein n=1 Tax=Paenibacillus puerhi TaxID=2692622 RepID=UPI00135A0AA8|nr:glycoside hydrolase family 43 protein [Paenibacillus puerhi]